jgi:biopolymer transport protein ExbB
MIYGLFETVSDFLATGGDVLFIIFITTFILWVFIIERFSFFRFRYPELSKEIIDQWNDREDKKSWSAHKIREYHLSVANKELNQYIPFIKTLVALCPLLGLLGTVTGMIAVFDVMALTGTGNARLMASGISMATIPTMAGMVTALSGLYFGSLFEEKVKKSIRHLEDKLEISA